ncbi:MAG TPA: LptF/LptG family permease [Pirellulales bacterium]|jgi:lipopolysaccharide export system permease protein|nr:LptF/LptG family permease [Pirellulales bacterium]
MRLLTRYVLWELLKVFLVALTGLTVILLMYGLVKQAHDEGLGPQQVLMLIPYILPAMMRYTIPATLLFAASSVYGRMSGSNEVVAIKSLGISPMAVLWPCFILSFMLSLLTVWLNDVAVTWGEAGIQRVVIESVEEIVYSKLRTQRSYTNRNVSILVKAVEGRRLIQPTFTFSSGDDKPPMTITAREAELRSDGEVLRIAWRHATIDAPGQEATFVLDQVEREIPLTQVSRNGDNSRIPTRVPLSLIPAERVRVREELDFYRRRRAAEFAVPLATGEFEAFDFQDWQLETNTIHDKWNHLYRLDTEPPRRWSAGFSCLCFALVGAPMAIWRRNADFLTSFFLCFGPILIVYYPLLVFGVEQAKSGALNANIVWLGNAVLAAWGSWMLQRKVVRY